MATNIGLFWFPKPLPCGEYAGYSTITRDNKSITNNSEILLLPTDLHLSPDGLNVLAITDYGSGTYIGAHLHRWQLSTPFDLSTAGTPTSVSIEADLLHLGTQYNPFKFHWSDNGNHVIVTASSRTFIFAFSLSTGWDITTKSLSYVINRSTLPGTTVANNFLFMMGFNPAGNRVVYHTASGANARYVSADLSTAFDLRTASGGTEHNPTDNTDTLLQMVCEGRVYYFLDRDEVRLFTFPSAFSFTSSEAPSENQISFNFDPGVFTDRIRGDSIQGSKIIVAGRDLGATNRRIESFTLS